MNYEDNDKLAGEIIAAADGLLDVDKINFLKYLIDNIEPDLAIKRALDWAVCGIWEIPIQLQSAIQAWGIRMNNAYYQDSVEKYFTHIQSEAKL